MAKNLDSLGYARVFRHARTGELVVDTDSLRRPNSFAGVDFGADPYDDDDFDDDDDDWDDDDEFEGDFDGDDFGELEGDFDGDFDGDELGDIEGDFDGDELGADGRRRRRHLRKKLARLDRREDRTRKKLNRNRRKHGVTRRRKKVTWGMTAVSGTESVDLPGGVSVKMRLQHSFRAKDLTFTGSAAGAKVTSIFFGDRSVWSSSEGIDVTVFGSTSFLRGLLKGQSLQAGLDITVNGSMTVAGAFAVTIIGSKPVTPHC